ENPDLVVVFGGDHVYKMDVRQMVDYHLDREAELTVAAIPVPVEESPSFGVIEIDPDWRIVTFVEKPPSDKAPQIPGHPGWVLASMGNYIFDTKTLIDELRADAESESESQHDFGRSILPTMVGRKRIFAYDFSRNTIEGQHETQAAYWRDVGTIDA